MTYEEADTQDDQLRDIGEKPSPTLADKELLAEVLLEASKHAVFDTGNIGLSMRFESAVRGIINYLKQGDK